ncbi:molybdate ABC transporter substrate-binding protein [Litoreibacter arenae]|uniref:Molybdenum ABC transporter, periplasmic molybdenum-binding protein ModA n=1 Tax=Litoreibacter arenae DSM 19593 TaxID=1123360 RepID=S9RRR4_9RHOB|nr:molybdate ABC transporter substrate-binding protein [Litoreibacter arenae]EPX80735.1 Molybdenum ABC transporter, periplasmic molybdenum-binding protein ModA [Litoreibacter arenae DSM 19593]
MIRRLFIALVFCLAALPVRAQDVVIFAASSLKTALDEVTEGLPVRISYGGSGLLARQIMQGAPADIFFSANEVWMDAAQDAGAIRAESRVELLSNALVIVGHEAAPFEDMLASDGRVATGLVASVPVGIYAKAYLERAGHWDTISPRLVETDNARAALALAARGEVPFAVVYASDAVAEPAIHVIHALPELPDLPIRYPVALTASAGPAADAVLQALQSDRARAIYAAHGFGTP